MIIPLPQGEGRVNSERLFLQIRPSGMTGLPDCPGAALPSSTQHQLAPQRTLGAPLLPTAACGKPITARWQR